MRNKRAIRQSDKSREATRERIQQSHDRREEEKRKRRKKGKKRLTTSWLTVRKKCVALCCICWVVLSVMGTITGVDVFVCVLVDCAGVEPRTGLVTSRVLFLYSWKHLASVPVCIDGECDSDVVHELRYYCYCCFGLLLLLCTIVVA